MWKWLLIPLTIIVVVWVLRIFLQWMKKKERKQQYSDDE